MPSNYVVVGGGAYLPGTAAYKKAVELNNLYSQNQATANALTPINPPTNFPSYPTGSPSFPGQSSGSGSASPNLDYAMPHTGQGPYGLVPQVPNPISTAMGSIAGNTSNLGALTTLGTDTTKLAANLGALPYQMNLPGYSGLLDQSSAGIASNLAGKIDPTTWQQMQQRMAERGVTMGISPESPAFDSSLTKAVYDETIRRQTLGQNQLNAAIARTPTGEQFNIAGQQINPEAMQSAQMYSNTLGAAPDPAQAAQANLDALLRAIEAGRAQGYGNPQGLPRMNYPSPGYRYPYGYSNTVGQTVFPGSPGFGYSTNGGWFPGSEDQTFNYGPQNPLVDYSTLPGGKTYPVDAGDYLQNPDLGIDSSVTPGGTPYPVDMTDIFNLNGFQGSNEPIPLPFFPGF